MENPDFQKISYAYYSKRIDITRHNQGANPINIFLHPRTNLQTCPKA